MKSLSFLLRQRLFHCVQGKNEIKQKTDEHELEEKVLDEKVEDIILNFLSKSIRFLILTVASEG